MRVKVFHTCRSIFRFIYLACSYSWMKNEYKLEFHFASFLKTADIFPKNKSFIVTMRCSLELHCRPWPTCYACLFQEKINLVCGRLSRKLQTITPNQTRKYSPEKIIFQLYLQTCITFFHT